MVVNNRDPMKGNMAISLLGGQHVAREAGENELADAEYIRLAWFASKGEQERVGVRAEPVAREEDKFGLVGQIGLNNLALEVVDKESYVRSCWFTERDRSITEDEVVGAVLGR